MIVSLNIKMMAKGPVTCTLYKRKDIITYAWYGCMYLPAIAFM